MLQKKLPIISVVFLCNRHTRLYEQIYSFFVKGTLYFQS